MSVGSVGNANLQSDGFTPTERPEDEELRKILESRKAEIKVVGVGGAGGNTISRLMQIGIVGAETIAVNSDAQDLQIGKILESRKAEIKVVGVGGAGGNTISRLMQIGIVGAETIAVNSDAQDLLYTDADR